MGRLLMKGKFESLGRDTFVWGALLESTVLAEWGLPG